MNNAVGSITLPDGATIPMRDVDFYPPTQFYYGGLDITDRIPRGLKLQFQGFDVAADNLRMDVNLSSAQQAEGGSTSTAGNFLDQISTHPLQAPLDALKKAVKDIPDPIKAGPIVILLGAILFLAITRRD